jgi:hypothetical protein
MKPLTAALAALLAAAPLPLLAQQPAPPARSTALPPLSATAARQSGDADLRRANNAIREGWKAGAPAAGVRLGQHVGAPPPLGLQSAGGIPVVLRPDSSRGWEGRRERGRRR